ncbi:MAG: serine/threonine protein kinase [Planctomycetes bacterium]|nr:serine/threonine protein kinase [Planctomycetota bacterium]
MSEPGDEEPGSLPPTELDLERTAVSQNGDPENEDPESTHFVGRPDQLPAPRRATPTGKLGWRTGQLVAGHKVLGKLGKGASGAVYLVEHLESGEYRALKAIPTPDEEARACFEREVKSQMGAGGHPNVAECFEAGEWEGHVYLVMEHLPGGSLRELVRQRGALVGHEAAEVVALLADGLAAVHAVGILHRDLKPANVMFDAVGVPKLVDFGLARACDAQSQTDALQGTPAYMAPEQTRTAQGTLSEQTDVYGLGGVLYSALTGDLPYACSDMLELLLEIAACDPIPPSERRPELEIPAALDAIVLRAMARSPKERYSSAVEFAKALREYCRENAAEADSPKGTDDGRGYSS